MTIAAIVDSLFCVLFAPPCAACGDPLERPASGPVCPACWNAIPPATPAFSVEGVGLCRAAGAYAGSLSAILHALKYQGRTTIAPSLSALIASRCADALADADIVVPVPLHPSRARERRFNQAALLARNLPLPCVHALVRLRPTPSQTDLPAQERRRNVKGAFALTGSGRRSLAGKLVVLVDDVATTGATLSECARAIREAEPAEVRAVTAARAL